MAVPAPELRQALLSLARTQLLAQSQRTFTYEAQAVGTMVFDAAFGTIVLASKSNYYLWAGALVLLVGSVLSSLVALFMKGASEMGPDVKEVLASRNTWPDPELEEQVIKDLRVDVQANRKNLDAKLNWVEGALVLLVLALGFELVGQL